MTFQDIRPPSTNLLLGMFILLAPWFMWLMSIYRLTRLYKLLDTIYEQQGDTATRLHLLILHTQDPDTIRILTEILEGILLGMKAQKDDLNRPYFWKKDCTP